MPLMTETDEELLKDLRVDYLPHHKDAAPYECINTYEQERRLAANLIDRLNAENERLRSALRPFALVAEYDIGKDESDVDLFRPMDARYARAPLIYVGQLRRALAIFQSTE